MIPSRVAERQKEMDEAWGLVKDLAEIQSHDLVRLTGCTLTRAQQILRAWEGRGVVHFVRSHRQIRVYAPGTRADHLASFKAQFEGSRTADPIENIWRAMRLLTVFTPRDLMGVANLPDAPVSEEDAKKYCQLLVKGEYLRVVEAARPGHRPATYRLARPTGPNAPRGKRAAVIFDSNLEEITYVAGVGVMS